MGERTCSVNGCEGEVKTRGWCVKHYKRLAKHGNLHGNMNRGGWHRPLWIRLFESLIIRPNGCLEWIGELSVGDYGRIKIDRRNHSVHRVVYEMLAGPIPNGLTLDHLCRNRACAAPDHLEPVTIRENTLRGETVPAVNSRKTRCIHGHPFNEANTHVKPNGHRVCITCRRRRDREYDMKRRGRAA